MEEKGQVYVASGKWKTSARKTAVRLNVFRGRTRERAYYDIISGKRRSGVQSVVSLGGRKG